MAAVKVKRPPGQWPVWQCTWPLQFRAQLHNCVTAEHSSTTVSLHANEGIEFYNKRPIAKGMINQHTVRPRTSW